MRLRHILLTTVCLVPLLGSIANAENVAEVWQTGSQNHAFTFQKGTDNQASINQVGRGNVAAIVQSGAESTQQINQTGNFQGFGSTQVNGRSNAASFHAQGGNPVIPTTVLIDLD